MLAKLYKCKWIYVSCTEAGVADLTAEVENPSGHKEVAEIVETDENTYSIRFVPKVQNFGLIFNYFHEKHSSYYAYLRQNNILFIVPLVGKKSLNCFCLKVGYFRQANTMCNLGNGDTHS